MTALRNESSPHAHSEFSLRASVGLPGAFPPGLPRPTERTAGADEHHNRGDLFHPGIRSMLKFHPRRPQGSRSLKIMGSSCSAPAAAHRGSVLTRASGVDTPDAPTYAPAAKLAVAPTDPPIFEAWATFVQVPKIRPLDRWPEGTLYEPWALSQEPEDMLEFLRGKPVPLGPLFAGKRTVLVGMPGAYTPNCSRVHLPQYVRHAADFFAAGVDQIVVMVANDTCVVQSWADANHAREAGIRIMSDRNCDVAQSTGLALDARGEVGRITVHRFCALLEDGVVKLIMTEPGGLGLTCSVAVPMLNDIRKRAYVEAHGPEHRWDRPIDSLSTGRATADLEVDGGSAFKPPARLSSAAKSQTSEGSRGRDSVVDQPADGSPTHATRIHSSGSRGSRGSSSYRYRLADTGPSPATGRAGPGGHASVTRVTIDVAGHESDAPADKQQRQ